VGEVTDVSATDGVKPEVEVEVDDVEESEVEESEVEESEVEASEVEASEGKAGEDATGEDATGERQDLLNGLSVDASRPEQPVLLSAAGEPIRTWQENYPYDRKVRRGEYERAKRILQIEMLKLQRWAKDTGARLIVVCEGRDAAGKGGSPSGSTRAARGSWPWTSRPSGRRGSGTSSVTWLICRLPGRSCSSTAPGTTGRAWSG
jgi:hypothetical protein